MKVVLVKVDDSCICGGCNWRASCLYRLQMMGDEEAVCANCFMDAHKEHIAVIE